MRIGIVGASGAGLYLACLLKLKHNDYEVTLIDKNNKIGKKVLATGNGRCNLLNLGLSTQSFNNPDFVNQVAPNLNIYDLISTLNLMGIYTNSIDEYLYPISMSAESHVKTLENLLNTLDVKVLLDTIVFDYKHTSLQTSKGKLNFDKVVFCVGGKSQEKLGSSGSFFEVFANHGYKINTLIPVLTPIIVKENCKEISGIRHKVLVKAYENEKLVFEELGEVLFKDDGLSGIVIFNLSRIIANKKNVKIHLDLFPDIDEITLRDMIDNQKKILDSISLNWLLPVKLSNYIEKLSKTCRVEKLLKNLTFTYVKNYGFEDSQLTKGGVSTLDISENLESKFEKNIYFAGEVIDIDGPCGGFNLGWCLICAKKLSEIL